MNPSTFPIGFKPEKFVVGEKKKLVAKFRAGLTFTGKKLIIPSVIGRYFMVYDLLVDGKSVLACPGAIPALAFSEEAIGVALEMPLARRDVAIVVERVKVPGPGWFVRWIRKLLWLPVEPEPGVFSGFVLGEAVGDLPGPIQDYSPEETTIGPFKTKEEAEKVADLMRGKS